MDFRVERQRGETGRLGQTVAGRLPGEAAGIEPKLNPVGQPQPQEIFGVVAARLNAVDRPGEKHGARLEIDATPRQCLGAIGVVGSIGARIADRVGLSGSLRVEALGKGLRQKLRPGEGGIATGIDRISRGRQAAQAAAEQAASPQHRFLEPPRG